MTERERNVLCVSQDIPRPILAIYEEEKGKTLVFNLF